MPPSPIRHLCSSHPASEVCRAKQEKDVFLVVYLHIPLGIHSFWGKLSSSQQSESKEAVVGFRGHSICRHLSFSFKEALQEWRLQPGCPHSSSPAMGAMGHAPAHGHRLGNAPPSQAPAGDGGGGGWRWLMGSIPWKEGKRWVVGVKGVACSEEGEIGNVDTFPSIGGLVGQGTTHQKG